MSPTTTTMKPMGFAKHIFAYVTLGLLCGWYYFLMILYPILIYFAIFRWSLLAASILISLTVLSVIPLDHRPWKAYMYSSVFAIWNEYFDFTYDATTMHNRPKGKKTICFEFPHGIFPMGQWLSVHHIKDITPGIDICGTAADIVFKFPVMRQLMAWTGTVHAKRSNIKKVLDRGDYLAIIPGGIAEMYLMNSATEGIYLRKRQNTVKAAIQEGANIIPFFFFGNSRIFTPIGTDDGSKSWFSKMSRKLRMSIVFFYGRQFLPVPYRHPIHMVSGAVIEVTQKDNPTEEEINDVLEKVIKSVKELYETKKPSWETRPLIIQ